MTPYDACARAADYPAPHRGQRTKQRTKVLFAGVGLTLALPGLAPGWLAPAPGPSLQKAPPAPAEAAVPGTVRPRQCMRRGSHTAHMRGEGRGLHGAGCVAHAGRRRLPGGGVEWSRHTRATACCIWVVRLVQCLLRPNHTRGNAEMGVWASACWRRPLQRRRQVGWH